MQGFIYVSKACQLLHSSLRPFLIRIKDSVMDYCSTEKDLGVIITPKITWDSHQNSIISKASRQLGLLKRTCHFIKNQSQKRALYITLVRSPFEHCREFGVLMQLLHKISLNLYKSGQ